MKEKQFILTFKESKELLASGHTVHAYGGIGYKIEMDAETAKPKVTGLVALDSVNYEIVIRR